MTEKRITASHFDLGDRAPVGADLRFDQSGRREVIDQNGNTGEHYELSRQPTPAHYLSLQAVLDEAFNQAAFGKGAERHAQSKPFEEQPMQKLIELYGVGFALGQAGKKMQEAQRMDVEPAVRELLGAINYIAGVVVHLEKANGR